MNWAPPIDDVNTPLETRTRRAHHGSVHHAISLFFTLSLAPPPPLSPPLSLAHHLWHVHHGPVRREVCLVADPLARKRGRE